MVLVALCPLVSALQGACSEASSATTGKRVVLTTRVEVSEGATSEFTNAFAFAINLDRVLVSVGELRYFEGEPIGQRAPSLFGIRSAWAHPGHYQAGDELGEMLEPEAVDLLASPTELTLGEGVTGQYRSAWFTFHAPPTGSLADELDGAVVLVSGEARGPERTLTFVASATQDQVLDTYGEPIVTGCPFEDGNVTGDGTITLIIDPVLWLDQVDFARVPETETEPDTVIVLDPAEAPHQAFVRGLRKAAAYSFSYQPNPEGGS
jgi:hypothetical protein